MTANRGSFKSKAELQTIIHPPGGSGGQDGDPIFGEPVDFRPYDLEQSVDAAVEVLKNEGLVKESDRGTVQLAKQYARRIDRALEIADREPGDKRAAELATKALYLGPHLLNTLKALGGTPEEYQKLTGTQPTPKLSNKSTKNEEEDDLVEALRKATQFTQ